MLMWLHKHIINSCALKIMLYKNKIKNKIIIKKDTPWQCNFIYLVWQMTIRYIWGFVLLAIRTLCYTSRYRKNKRRGRVSGPVCHCPWNTPIGRRGRIAVPGPPWIPHPRHPFPLLLATRLSPSFPCESIVRSRGAPWLGSGNVRGWLLVGSRGLVEVVATTPD